MATAASNQIFDSSSSLRSAKSVLRLISAFSPYQTSLLLPPLSREWTTSDNCVWLDEVSIDKNRCFSLVIQHIPDRSLSIAFRHCSVLLGLQVFGISFYTGFYVFCVSSRMRFLFEGRLVRSILITTGHTLAVRRGVKKIHLLRCLSVPSGQSIHRIRLIYCLCAVTDTEVYLTEGPPLSMCNGNFHALL